MKKDNETKNLGLNFIEESVSVLPKIDNIVFYNLLISYLKLISLVVVLFVILYVPLFVLFESFELSELFELFVLFMLLVLFVLFELFELFVLFVVLFVWLVELLFEEFEILARGGKFKGQLAFLMHFLDRLSNV